MLAQALKTPSADEIAAAEVARQSKLLLRAQWLNDPYTQEKIATITGLRNGQASAALSFSLVPGKEAEALCAARNAAVAANILDILLA